MSQFDICYGLPGSTGAILLTLNKQDEADKLCSQINRADVFQGDGLEASVREVEREQPPEEPKQKRRRKVGVAPKSSEGNEDVAPGDGS